jgi:hypothetical protein
MAAFNISQFQTALTMSMKVERFCQVAANCEVAALLSIKMVDAIVSVAPTV